MSRRDLGMVALGTAAAAQTPVAEYRSALDGFESRVPMENFDAVRWTLKHYESAPLKLTFSAQNRRQALAWQSRLRAKVAELLGGFPAARTPLNPVTLEVREFPRYRREKVVFESRPGMAVQAYLLTPKAANPPYPAMICVPGHGRGVDDIVGIDEKGRDRTDKAGYQHDFAIQAVEHGMAAVAIEPLGFGCRRTPAAIAKNLGGSVCQPVSGAAFLLGETMIGWRVWDIMRAVDWIETRKELNHSRIGCMGISGGGTCTTFAAALEPRISVAYVSGYLNTFRDSIYSISHCIDNYVPGILRWAEMYDVAGLIAPRPLFVESGEKDNIFPVAASRASFERVRKVYEVFDASQLCEQEVFDDRHVFCGRRGLPFVKQHLGAA